MKTHVLLVSMSFLLSTMLYLIMLLMGKKNQKEMEKLTMFECGFEKTSTGRAPFSLKFFLLTVLFLIFDIEIAILLPLAFIIDFPDQLISADYSFLLLLILIGGLIHEWNQGMLEWIT